MEFTHKGIKIRVDERGVFLATMGDENLEATELISMKRRIDARLRRKRDISQPAYVVTVYDTPEDWLIGTRADMNAGEGKYRGYNFSTGLVKIRFDQEEDDVGEKWDDDPARIYAIPLDRKTDVVEELRAAVRSYNDGMAALEAALSHMKGFEVSRIDSTEREAALTVESDLAEWLESHSGAPTDG